MLKGFIKELSRDFVTARFGTLKASSLLIVFEELSIRYLKVVVSCTLSGNLLAKVRKQQSVV